MSDFSVKKMKILSSQLLTSSRTRSTANEIHQWEDLINEFQRAENIIFVTGAGISVGAGIPVRYAFC
jgi:copper homeostasis protein CutC